MKAETVPNLKNRVWKWFSRYIRLRDATNGWCKCITCNKRRQWNDLIDAGHFVPKSRSGSVYFNETNVNAQCRQCNYFKSVGAEYRVAIDKKYGKGTADEMEKLGQTSHKFEIPELKKMLKHYIKEVHKLEKTNL